MLKLNVTLIEYTPQPEKIVAAAAKLCYSDSGCENIMDGLDEEKTQSFVKMLSDMGHESPIEHVSFTFGIEGVSRALLAQITRHRHASFSVQSQRYVR
ncbi:MAG: FAD-dependent thymidylate synthase, partial [Ruminococcus sp.]